MVLFPPLVEQAFLRSCRIPYLFHKAPKDRLSLSRSQVCLVAWGLARFPIWHAAKDSWLNPRILPLEEMKIPSLAVMWEIVIAQLSLEA